MGVCGRLRISFIYHFVLFVRLLSFLGNLKEPKPSEIKKSVLLYSIVTQLIRKHKEKISNDSFATLSFLDRVSSAKCNEHVFTFHRAHISNLSLFKINRFVTYLACLMFNQITVTKKRSFISLFF